jgi:DNA repair protein RecO (recombination protein O)
MALIHDTGVTLRRLDFSESSQVLALFTRHHGKIRAIAKGIKRSTKTRFAVGIDLLEVGELVLSVRQPRQEALANLTEWRQRRALAGLRERLDRFYAAQYAAEITDALTEDWDPHPDLCDGLTAVLDALCRAEAVLEPILHYQRLLLWQVGSWPELEVCVICRRPPASRGDLWFSSLEGGLLCRDCEARYAEKRLLDRRILPLVRWASAGASARPPAEGFEPRLREEAFKLLNYHASHLMGREPLLGSKVLDQERRNTRSTQRGANK